jgi:Ca2+-binding RTX toxin-like protein
MRLNSLAVTALAAILTMLALGGPSAASAATVEVQETLGASESGSALTFNSDEIRFQAAPGEANDLRITAPAAAPGSPLEVEVVDAGAPLEAKVGCSGGGAPGTVVRCAVHAPKLPEGRSCGRDCLIFIPNTEWRLHFTVDLGNGPNTLDAGGLPAIEGPAMNMAVRGGPARDRIVTGPGNDKIDPGEGDDEVVAGKGYDTITAGAGPDGNDVFALGDGNEAIGGEVSYEARAEPLRFQAGVGGGAGETDRISEALIVGGSGDDTLVAGTGAESFEGAGGDDTLVGNARENWLYGGPGNDRLVGGDGEDMLVGGSGDDVMEGGGGNDRILEWSERSAFGPEQRNVPVDESNGNDEAQGGPGDDRIDLGVGADVIHGEEGSDSLIGGAGADTVDGEGGNDGLVGGTGPDHLSGGSGNDRFFAGPQPVAGPYYPAVPDKGPSGPDAIACGPDDDAAKIDAADSVNECEKVVLKPNLQVRRAIRRPRGGTASLLVAVPSPGRVLLLGGGVATSRRTAHASRGGFRASLPVRLRGAARRELRRTGRARVTVRVLYVRRLGGVFAKKRQLTLRLTG